MTDAVRGLPRYALATLADAVAGGRLAPPFRRAEVARHVPEGEAGAVAKELAALAGDGLAPRHLALLLRSLEAEKLAAQSVADRVELVWSWGDHRAEPRRRTDVVVAELFRGAERRVLVASYGLERKEDKAHRLFAPLARRMEERPDLQVRLCVNIGRRYDDGRPDAELVEEFATRFRQRLWPGGRLPEVFHDPRALDVSGTTRACLHAKCVVVDGERALVTSANFTEAAHARNIEAGLLVEDPRLAAALEDQLDQLIEHGALERVPTD